MKLKLHILLFVFLLSGSSFGQELTREITLPRNDTLLADSLFVKGMKLLEEGKLKESRAISDQILNLSDRVDYRAGRANSYYLSGCIEAEDNDLPAALRYFFMAVQEYEWTGDQPKLSEVYGRMGDIYRAGGILSKATEYYSKARAAALKLPVIQRILLEEKLADTYFALQQYDSALSLYKGLYDHYSPEKPGLAMVTLMQITSCLYKMGLFSEALEYNLAALNLAREQSGDPLDEVEALNSLGYNYKYLEEYEKSAGYFKEAASLAEKKFPDRDIYTVTLVNLAIARQNEGKTDQAYATLFKAEKVAGQQGNVDEQARILHLLSYMYYLEKDYHNANVYNRQAMVLASASQNEQLLLNTYQVASLIRTALYDYEAGMMYYQEYLSLRDSLELQKGLAQQELSQQEYTVERAEKELSQVLFDREIQNMELKNLRIESEKKQQELELLRKTSELQDATIRNQELEKNRALQELLLAEERLAAEKKDREIQDLRMEQQLQESELKRRELEQIQQQQEIAVLTKDKELNELTIQRQRARNSFLAGVIVLALIILFLVIRNLRYARKTNHILQDQRNKIQQQKEAIESQYDIIKIEREKSERLLLNILPVHTANELKEKGRAIPKQYSMVTVLFTDFVGFTKVAEKLTPEQLVQELDLCFMEFDRIIGNHNMEKIKTIGDAYMCAGGIPLENDTNPFDAVEAAIEINAFIERTRAERKKLGQAYWELRIGIHTGEVIAGVVGKKKFAYDIWGDAVNTASRMESSGEAGKVNISGSTFELVKDRFNCTHRGKVYAKNKGEIDMYFVEGKM